MSLETRSVGGGYGPSRVLEDLSLKVGAGEVVVLLGRNGTGKTTALRAVMGMLPRCSGAVLLEGNDLSGLPAHQRARKGLGYVPQGREIFASVTVGQNLRFGLILGGMSMWDDIPAEVMQRFPWLQQRLRQRAGTLSGGEQQMLAIARMLVARPKVLLLDEPTEGLSPIAVEMLEEILTDLREEGKLAILLVEQNLPFALRLGTRGYVMEKGRIVSEGDPRHLQTENVIARHLSI